MVCKHGVEIIRINEKKKLSFNLISHMGEMVRKDSLDIVSASIQCYNYDQDPPFCLAGGATAPLPRWGFCMEKEIDSRGVGLEAPCTVGRPWDCFRATQLILLHHIRPIMKAPRVQDFLMRPYKDLFDEEHGWIELLHRPGIVGNWFLRLESHSAGKPYSSTYQMCALEYIS